MLITAFLILWFCDHDIWNIDCSYQIKILMSWFNSLWARLWERVVKDQEKSLFFLLWRGWMQVSRELCGRTESKYFILCRGWMQYFVWMVAVGPENNTISIMRRVRMQVWRWWKDREKNADSVTGFGCMFRGCGGSTGNKISSFAISWRAYL
jgi:hypothetical protein